MFLECVVHNECNQIKVVIVHLPVISMAIELFGLVLTISKQSYDLGPRVHLTAEIQVLMPQRTFSKYFSKNITKLFIMF